MNKTHENKKRIYFFISIAEDFGFSVVATWLGLFYLYLYDFVLSYVEMSEGKSVNRVPYVTMDRV